MKKPFGCEQSHTLESFVLKHGATKFDLGRDAAADFCVVDVELLIDWCRTAVVVCSSYRLRSRQH